MIQRKNTFRGGSAPSHGREISRAHQARLIGGWSDHHLPWKVRYRAHKRLKGAPTLRAGVQSLPITIFPGGGKRPKDRIHRASAQLVHLMSEALINRWSGAPCRCYYIEDASLYFVRTSECHLHRKVS
jgi:hypothetical protein